MKKEALKAIKQKFGDRASISEREILVYSHDIIALPSSLMFNFKADAVVRVKTVEEVVGLMQTCQEYKFPITPRGASTSGYGGVLPTKGGVMCDLSGMNKIIGLDESNLNVTVEPGVIWKDMDDFLLKWGYTLCSYPTSALSSTVGGWAAEGGIGVGSTKYGGIENQVTELEIVLPNGHVFNTYKDSPAELGLKSKNEFIDLFVGSYGTLGIATKITLKVRPAEEAIPVCATFTQLDEAVKAIIDIIKKADPYHISLSDKNLQALRTLYGEQCVAENTLLSSFTGPNAKENVEIAKNIIERNGANLQDQKAAQKEWEERFYPLRIKRLGPSLVPSQVIVPIEALPALIRDVQKKYPKALPKNNIANFIM
jgi:FAD/FMN-containing dehydrogenase